jgi:hypothetical protein
MIIYKHAFFIKKLFEMNGEQPAQQELFQASLLEFKKTQKMSGLTRFRVRERILL